MNHIFGLLFSPRSEWEKIGREGDGYMCYFRCVLILAALPAIAWYFGLTTVGWEFGGRVIRMTNASAGQIMVLFYLAMLAGVGFLGYMVHWMSETYEVENSSVSKGVSIVGYTFVPMFIFGLAGFYPILWLDIILFSIAAGYTVYLLYIGVPVVLKIPAEKGFLYASAMTAVGLVMCAALLGATVVLWEMGAMPVFVD